MLVKMHHCKAITCWYCGRDRATVVSTPLPPRIGVSIMGNFDFGRKTTNTIWFGFHHGFHTYKPNTDLFSTFTRPNTCSSIPIWKDAISMLSSPVA